MSEIHTRITELLDTNNIGYRILPHNEPVYTVETAARQRGVETERIVKSILLCNEGRDCVMACVMGNSKLDIRKVRSCLGGEWKKIRFADKQEIRDYTGFVQGAVAPVGLPDSIRVIVDESILDHKKICISSGDLMAGLELETGSLLKITGAVTADISKE